MNTEQINGHLRVVKGWALESWGRVTHDPWLRIAETSFPTRVVGAGERRRAASR